MTWGDKMEGYAFPVGRCQRCGKKTMDEDGEILGTMIILEKRTDIYHSECLGEWCSEECFRKDIEKYR